MMWSLLEANDCHNPAGSPAGGQFCSRAGAGHQRPVPLRVKTVEEAVLAILEGKVVELAETKQISTVLRTLAGMAVEAREAGKAAPNFDLCKVSVVGTNLFCVDKLRNEQYPDGVPRVEMPQMSGAPVPGTPADRLPKNEKGRVNAAQSFIDHLLAQGLKVAQGTEKAAFLKATQAELVGAEVAQMMTAENYDPAKAPIFISRDNYVVDGHHRWAAVVGRDSEDGTLGDLEMKTIRIDAPISEVLKLANTWSREFGIKQKESVASLHQAQRRWGKAS